MMTLKYTVLDKQIKNQPLVYDAFFTFLFPGNILLTDEKAQKERGLVLIDYEYAGYNYR